jgi:hypothetical protein
VRRFLAIKGLYKGTANKELSCIHEWTKSNSTKSMDWSDVLKKLFSTILILMNIGTFSTIIQIETN